MRLGRIRPLHRSKLTFGMYATDLSSLPTPPAKLDYAEKAADSLLHVYLNDRLGDCVVAGGYHLVGVWTGNAVGSAFIATDVDIILDYSAIGGYVEGDPSTDQGCNEQTAIDFWTKTGFADGSKLAGSIGISASNELEVKIAAYLFENLFLGIELPDAWIAPFPSEAGFVWDVAGEANPDNGHCVVVVGYNAEGVQICSWGLIGTITWAALKKYCSHSSGGEMYALFSPDQVASGSEVAPNGFDWTTLEADFKKLAAA